MADLDPLIRFRKFNLEEKQKFLARLYAEADKLLHQREGVLDQIEKEKDVLSQGDLDSFVASSGFGHFLYKARAEVEEIKKQEKLLDTRIDIAIEDMRESFGELKKIEITQRQRMEKERKRLLKRENDMFEEIGLTRFISGDDKI